MTNFVNNDFGVISKNKSIKKNNEIQYFILILF